MGFQDLPDLECAYTVSIGGFNKKQRKDNPTEFVGHYVGRRKIVDKKNKQGWQYLFIFRDEKGETAGVWGKTDLNKRMATAPELHLLKIIHTGMRPTPNGDMHTYKVQGDLEQKLEDVDFVFQDLTGGSTETPPRATAPHYQSASDDNYDNVDDYVGEESDISGEDTALDEAPPARAQAPKQAAKPPTADRIRQVQEQLRNRK